MLGGNTFPWIVVNIGAVSEPGSQGQDGAQLHGDGPAAHGGQCLRYGQSHLTGFLLGRPQVGALETIVCKASAAIDSMFAS